MDSAASTSAPTTPTSWPNAPEHQDDELLGPARAAAALDPQARAHLGLPPGGTGIDPLALPPLDDAQWADPEVVAARFALVRTNYDAGDDPAELWARTFPYAVPRFGQDLASSSGGAAGLADLRSQGVLFIGDVVGLITTERSADRSVVDLTVRRTLIGDEDLQPGRVEFWRLTLVREAAGHWMVADLELS